MKYTVYGSCVPTARHSAQMIKGAGGILDRSMYPAAVYGDETFAVRLTRVVSV